ncbi:GTP-binding protein [Neisseria gonorrhoeae 3502]|uniref:GTP-binding protein n=1 Tax=Neisseria gonorrhoeae 3502 TaxID=1193404 RepID=A0AA44ZHJ3_NEIGO|nr:GTP-binding protein [Neisseria gonorrhoeae SK8976]KLS16100.1 GTP-binding protein [Neisseria gonorrhoeae SK17973]KLS18446.1 GTP-binding protein [Neisseria gonorrhoeae SK29471]KLS99279.1 GTP-binding protein [Neisseria gonorrhoeae SK12684]PHJ36178.1 GTP-binding protein [Neisseria gonorrhoeae 3502]SCW17730.1 GTP-binding protein [Neisseria gonorrhoeae]
MIIARFAYAFKKRADAGEGGGRGWAVGKDFRFAGEACHYSF